jgi:hypothetical protein
MPSFSPLAARRPLLAGLALVAGVLLTLPGGTAHALTATWGGGTGVWSDATRWSTDPLFPCNGQGGNTYDVVLGTGTATLDLDCTIDSQSQTGGSLDAPGRAAR